MAFEFGALSSRLGVVILVVPLNLQLFLSPSDNFKLPEVLPDVPPVVLPDVHLEVHLEVLTSSDHT